MQMKRRRYTLRGSFIILLLFLMVTVPQTSHATITDIEIDTGKVINDSGGIFTVNNNGNFIGTNIKIGGSVDTYDGDNYVDSRAIGVINFSAVSTGTTGGNFQYANPGSFNIAGLITSGTMVIKSVTFPSLTDTGRTLDVVVSFVSATLVPDFAAAYGVNTSVTGTMDIELTMNSLDVLTASNMRLQLETSPAEKMPSVPIPAAGWLLGSGVVGLLGIRRKMRG